MKSATGIQRTAQSIQTLFLLRIMAGKLEEGWQMLSKSYFGAKLSQAYNNVLSKTSNDCLDELKVYFSKYNTIHKIRNEYAFHYDRQRIQEEIKNIPQDESQIMFVPEHNGNCLLVFADTMINSSVLNAIDSATPNRAMDVLFEEIALKVCRWFQDFGYGWIETICQRLGGKSITDIEMQDVPTIGDVRLPYFIQR